VHEQAGNSPDNIMNRCDRNPTDQTFTYKKFMRNKCTCIENVGWATKVLFVCGLLERNPSWAADCRDV
jgi:hypothetical protein